MCGCFVMPGRMEEREIQQPVQDKKKLCVMYHHSRLVGITCTSAIQGQLGEGSPWIIGHDCQYVIPPAE